MAGLRRSVVSRAAALALLAGGDPGFVAGVTWVPEEALAESSGGLGPADGLAAYVNGAGLDFAFVPGSAEWGPHAVATLHAEDAAAFWVVEGPLGRIARESGWVETLRRTAAAPESQAAALDRSLHDALVEVRAGLAAGADAFVVADDLAGARGFLVSPDYALEVLVPLYGRIAREARAAMAPCVFHSDGDTRVLYAALAAEGFSALHVASVPTDRLAAAIEAARHVGLAVLGGVAAAALSSDAESLEAVERAATFGHGVALADDGGITSAEQLAALARVVRALRARA